MRPDIEREADEGGAMMDARGQREVADLVAEVEEIILHLRDEYGDEALRAFISRLVAAYSAEIEEAQAS